MARWNQTVDEFLVVRSKLQLQCFDIAVPMRFRARPCNRRTHERVVQHPGNGEGNRSRATLSGISREFLRDGERLRTPFGLLNTLVAASRTGVRGRCAFERI